jgi:hypothetical protein
MACLLDGLSAAFVEVVGRDSERAVGIADELDFVASLEAGFDGQRGWNAAGETVSPSGDLHRLVSRIIGWSPGYRLDQVGSGWIY